MDVPGNLQLQKTRLVIANNMANVQRHAQPKKAESPEPTTKEDAQAKAEATLTSQAASGTKKARYVIQNVTRAYKKQYFELQSDPLNFDDFGERKSDFTKTLKTHLSAYVDEFMSTEGLDWGTVEDQLKLAAKYKCKQDGWSESRSALEIMDYSRRGKCTFSTFCTQYQ